MSPADSRCPNARATRSSASGVRPVAWSSGKPWPDAGRRRRPARCARRPATVLVKPGESGPGRSPPVKHAAEVLAEASHVLDLLLVATAESGTEGARATEEAARPSWPRRSSSRARPPPTSARGRCRRSGRRPRRGRRRSVPAWPSSAHGCPLAARTSRAVASSASPARMAARRPNTLQAVGRPRRLIRPSMTSSCRREKWWASSTATAAGTASAGSPPTAWALSSTSVERTAGGPPGRPAARVRPTSRSGSRRCGAWRRGARRRRAGGPGRPAPPLHDNSSRAAHSSVRSSMPGLAGCAGISARFRRLPGCRARPGPGPRPSSRW